MSERESDAGKAAAMYAHECSQLRAQLAAAEERVAELERDGELLNFLADDPPFDEFHGIDIHETWGEVASQHGREEANDSDKRESFRVLLERARNGQGA